jgi:hypothetical protein
VDPLRALPSDPTLVELADVRRRLVLDLERQRDALRRVDAAAGARAAGRRWSAIALDEPLAVVPVVTAMHEELGTVSAATRRAIAGALRAEGLMMEDIAKLFGVSRQRISALLRASA